MGGHRHGELATAEVQAVLDAYPRLDFKEGFAGLVEDQAARKQGCWANRAVEAGLRARMDAAPFDS